MGCETMYKRYHTLTYPFGKQNQLDLVTTRLFSPVNRQRSCNQYECYSLLKTLGNRLYDSVITDAPLIGYITGNELTEYKPGIPISKNNLAPIFVLSNGALAPAKHGGMEASSS